MQPSMMSIKATDTAPDVGKSKDEQAHEYLALSAIKEKTGAYRVKKIDYNDKLLTEYVKFLIGQTRNPHFAIRRSDFSQNYELH